MMCTFCKGKETMNVTDKYLVAKRGISLCEIPSFK